MRNRNSILNAPENQRNFGFWSEDEQLAMAGKTIAIAGAGGDGHDLARALVMMASPKEIRIADPEVFEPENSNRVAWADSTTYGRNKVDVLREGIEAIRPDTNVVVYDEGVTEDNAAEFVAGADLVLDESELTHLEIGTSLAREARANGIPNLLVMNIGFAAIATSFDPNGKYTFEKMMGIPKGAPLDEVRDMDVDFSGCLPYIPPYGDIKTLTAVQEGAPLPSIVQGVKQACALGSSEAFLHLVSDVGNHRPAPTMAPKWRYMDALTGAAGTIRTPRTNYYARAAFMAARNAFGINPSTNYTNDERNRRLGL